MNVSYKQAWRAKEKTKLNICEDVSHTYKLLPWLCNHLKDSNSGTIAEWTCDADGNFKQLFIAYGCSVNGFLLGYCPIIAVDSSFLSVPYRGALYSATAFNADDEMYPLTFGILSSENYEDWLWFLQHLKELIGSLKITIISDRHTVLLESVGEVFGIENHSHYFTHLKENFGNQATRKNMGGKKGKEDALQLLNAIAYARLDEDYDIAIANLAAFSSHLAMWVEETEPEHWAMSKFPNKHWDKITSNLTESFNAWVCKEHHHSAIDFVHEHRNKLGTLLHKHEEEMKNWKQPVGPNIEKKLKENISRSLSTVVYPYMTNKFLVRTGNADISVDLLARECTCQYWQMLGIPCEHACAAIRTMGDNVYSFVDECYLLSTKQRIYNDGLKPVNTHDMPAIDSDGIVQFNVSDCTLVSLKPPKTRRPAGRPREKRIESNHIKKRSLHCSLCLEEGHNRGTCKNPNPGAQI
ncbi:hypothetical protein L1049_000843 [Liquidambar formosana]|uniref:SWIM-type domain-containing protein n=1 Tax=Liquidambar formosana TaxID=63359 RepID=A0AAP0NC70_LIQFO